MSSSNTNGFFLSTLLHASVIGVFLFFTYAVNQQIKEQPKVFELVAGEGDNYMATEAPALGVPGGLKVNIPKMPTPESAAPEPAAPVPPAPEPVVEKTPITAAPPTPKTPPKTTTAKAEPKEEPIRDFSKDVNRIAKKRAARLEAKYRAEREAAERKAKEEELKKHRMTKEEFDRQNRNEAGAKRGGGSIKVSKIDAEGIATGVTGGKGSKPGAGGKALTRDEGEALDLYFSLLKRRLKEALDKPPGLADTLVATVEVRIGADGTLSGAHIKRSSGSDEFDRAALEAVARVRSIGPRPDGKSEILNIPFRMREEDDE